MSKLNQLAQDLIQAREGKQLSIEQLSQKTRIRIELLKNFESGNFRTLPPPYIIPMMKVYAKELGFPESVVDECKHELGIDDVPDTTKQELNAAVSQTGFRIENITEKDVIDQVQGKDEPLWLTTAFSYRYAIMGSTLLFFGLVTFSYWWFFLREKAVIIRQTARNTEQVREELKADQKSIQKPEIPKEWLSGKDTLFASTSENVNVQPTLNQPITQNSIVSEVATSSTKDSLKLKKNNTPLAVSGVANSIVIDQLSSIPRRNSSETEEFRLLSQEQGSLSDQNQNSEKKSQSKKYRLVFQYNSESDDTCKVSVFIEGKGTRSVSLYSSNRTARFEADTTMSISVERVESVSVTLNEAKVPLPKVAGDISNFRVTEP